MIRTARTDGSRGLSNPLNELLLKVKAGADGGSGTVNACESFFLSAVQGFEIRVWCGVLRAL